MNQTKRPHDSIDLALFLISLGGISFSMVVSGGMILFGFLAWIVEGDLNIGAAITNASVIAFIGLCALPTFFLSGRALLGLQPPAPRPASSVWLTALALLPFSLALGHFAFTRNLLPAVIGPIVHILSASIPVLVAITLVRRTGPALSLRRTWAQFIAGLWAAPALSLLLEVIVLIPILIVIAIALLTTEVGQMLFETIIASDPLSTTLPEEVVLQLIKKPHVVVLTGGYIVVLVPIIEEAIKTLGIWPLLRRGLTPAAAFLGGALGGAGYALFEALFLSQPDTSWASTMVARIGATLMHTFTAGVASAGLAQAIGERKWRHFARAFLIAVGMHAMWNAAALGIGLGALVDEAENLILSTNLIRLIYIGGVGMLLALSTQSLMGLIRKPHRLIPDPESVETISESPASDVI